MMMMMNDSNDTDTGMVSYSVLDAAGYGSVITSVVEASLAAGAVTALTGRATRVEAGAELHDTTRQVAPHWGLN